MTSTQITARQIVFDQHGTMSKSNKEEKDDNDTLWNAFFSPLLHSLSNKLSPSTIKPESMQVQVPFDVSRYLGRWFEIARLPVPFEYRHVNVTATYSISNDAKKRQTADKINPASPLIRVVNQSFKNSISKESNYRRIEGIGVVPDMSNAAKIKIRLGKQRTWANYWVFAVDELYATAIVGSPNRSVLWILVRHLDQELDSDWVQGHLQRLKSYGFPIHQMITTKHQNFPSRS